jgi:tetratricopeptide (TPR) repeat protein
LKYYEDALKMYINSGGTAHAFTAMSYNKLGDYYNGLEEWGEALNYYKQAFDVRRSIILPQRDDIDLLIQPHVDTALIQMNIGIAYAQLGQFPEAIDSINNAVRIYEILVGESNVLTRRCRTALADVYRKMEEWS